MRAYVVVATQPGTSRDVARPMSGLPGVKMADACWGSRDVFAVVEVRGSQELNQLVIDQVQKLAPGQHTIRVTQSGFKDWSREITVQGGSEAHLSASLDKLD